MVVSALGGEYTVTCTITGGTVLSGSLTGPEGLNIINFSPVSTRNYRGQDSYRASTGTRTGGSDGDTYQCTATNGVPSPDGSDSATLRGTCQTHAKHTHTHQGCSKLNFIGQAIVNNTHSTPLTDTPLAST